MKKQMKLFTNMTKPFVLFVLLFALGIGQMWGDTRLFTTGQKIFFQDAQLSNLGNACWKSGTNGNVYAHFFNKKRDSGDDETAWAESAGRLVYGTDGAANAIYEFTVPELNGASASWWGVLFTRGTAASWDGKWNQTTDQYPAQEKSLFTISNTKDGDNFTGSWSVMPEMLCSDITDPEWSKEDGLFFTQYSGEKGIVKINCTASQSFQFIVFDGTYYKSYADETNTTWADYGPKTDGGYNFQFRADEAGEYIFQWDKTNHKLWVWEPKARFAKQKYIYFDARNLTGSNSDYWQRGNFTARFWFKYYDSGSDKGSVDCTKANALEDWVYYALVPDDEYLGQIQMNRLPVSTEDLCVANVAYAKDRTNVTQNCLKEETGKADYCNSWTPQWTTYCPPTTSETFADNGTSTISWQPNTNDGTTSAKAIWVKTGTTLKVAATASKAVADDNMTIKYDFKVNSTSQQDGTTASYTHSASTNNTTYELSADIYTNYNLDNTKNSTKHTQSSIFYKALNTYSVTHTLSGVTKASGRLGDDAAAYYVAYDATYEANAGYYLPSDITVTIGGATKTKGTDYTWTVTDGTSGALAILTDKIDGNVVVTINGVWRWSVAGSWLYYPETVNWDADTYAMGNITKVSGDDVCSVEITLPANTNYTFQVVDRSSSPYTWWGNSNDDSAPFYMTYGNSTNWGFDGDYKKACGITTAGAGTYTFTWNITDKQLTVTYPASYYVTAATAGGGTVTPSSATYMSTSVGGEITATPNYAYYFNGWTSNAGGSFTNASAATTTFKPASADATVTAAFAERTAFIEANFQVYNSDRSVRTKTGNSWSDNSTAIKMNYDAGNNRYYLHTYSTPAELKEQLNNADAYFYIKTSSSTSSIANDVSYHASGADALQSLSAYGSSNKKATSTVYTANSFKFTGSEDGYVIIYFDGSNVWYELECALSYYGGEGATGDAPAARTYYAYGSNQTAASNSYSKTGYTFDHWDTASDDGGTDYAPEDDVAMTAHEVCLHAMWTINNHDITYTAPSHGSYTIKAGDASAVSENVDDVNYSTTVTLAATPASGYSFSSWSLTGATAADASSANTTFSMPDNDVTVEASFTEDKHTVTVEIGSAGGGVFSYGGSSSLTTKEISGIGISTATGDIVVDSLNPAWRFKKWEYDGAKITITTGGYTSKTIRVNATADATITAVFEPRFGLIGSLNEDGDPAGGMPNKDGKTWGNVRSEDYEADFEVFSFTAVGTGEGTGVDLRCTRTLESNKQYKFQIVDRATVGRDRFCLAADGSALLEANESITLNYKEQSNANVLINTIGYGEYTFRITNIAATTYNPTVTVDRPTDSKQLTLKCGYSIDAASSVTLSNDGGTAMGHTDEGTDEGGDGFDISDGGFFKSGSHITFTATPATGYVFEGWYTDNTYETRFATDNPMTMTEGTNANVTVYARFIEKTNTFTDGASTGYWNNTSNWSLGSLPTINERVVITKPVTVDIAHALAKRIILDQSSTNTGALTIQANKGLEVQQTIQVYNGSSYGPTTAADLVLESSSSGNASLIFENSNEDQATVQMYSPATISTNWNWQFMGTPFTSANALYSYYGAYLYEWQSDGTWDAVANGGTMTPFTGYCITQSSPTTYVMDGTLNPNDDVEISIPAGLEFVMANSWTAPISVCNFTNTTLPLDNQTIYLFNTGHAESDASAGSAAGTYIAMPINSAVYTGNYLIAPMEGFYVNNKGGSAVTVTLKYDELVRPSGSHTDIVAGAMHAPKRVDAVAEPDVMKIKAIGSRYADRVVILVRPDFSAGFDNGWDGKNLNEPGVAPILYALRADGTKDAVSAIPTFEGTVVGFRLGEDNQYTFSFEYDGEDIWYLNDLKQQTSTLIDAEHSYSFSTAADDAEARFIISATPIANMPTGCGQIGSEAEKVKKVIINDQLYIIRAGRMYNAVGSIVK
ncbi:MAG: InlB B-repeat-containing protein [Paludibacteraceae bacterium]|nr:InlB B-repeat-containing protein [Paludibacteraceae bacterium]